MNKTQLILAIYAFLTSGLIFYGYARRNKYFDVLLAAIGVAVVGISLTLSAFGIAAVIARGLFNLGTGMAIVVIALLGVRIVKGAYGATPEEGSKSETPTETKPKDEGPKSQGPEGPDQGRGGDKAA